MLRDRLLSKNFLAKLYLRFRLAILLVKYLQPKNDVQAEVTTAVATESLKPV